MEMVQFIHAADIHLDSPFAGLKSLPAFIWEAIYRSTFKALTTVVDLAIEKKVDFVCFAGDIFDNDERSIKAQAFFRNEMERLNAAAIPVYLLHGNHDYIEDRGLHLKMPPNVITFAAEVETHLLTTIEQEKIALSGFSYDQKWITKRRIQEYPQRFSSVDFHIGILHGFKEGLESEHGKYAPFTLAELKNRHYDYWALGHIHKRLELSSRPPIVYPGNTQGRSSKETGAKGCELVHLTDTKKEHIFYPTASIRWENITISVKGLRSLNDVYRCVQTAINERKSKTHSLFLSVLLENTAELHGGVRKKIDQGELLEALQQIPESAVFVWVARLIVKQDDGSFYNYLELFPSEWKKAIDEVQEENTFTHLTDPLFDHAGITSWAESRDEEYRKKIIMAAQDEVRIRMGFERSDESEN